MTIDDQAEAAFRAYAWREWDEHARILVEAAERNELGVLYKYAHLLNWAFLKLFQRELPNATRNDIIRYVAEVRTRTPVLHPREMDPRLAEEILITALTGAPAATLTQQGYDPDKIRTATDFLVKVVLGDGWLHRAEKFDELMAELRPLLEELKVPDGLPDDLDDWIDQLQLGNNANPPDSAGKTQRTDRPL